MLIINEKYESLNKILCNEKSIVDEAVSVYSSNSEIYDFLVACKANAILDYLFDESTDTEYPAEVKFLLKKSAGGKGTLFAIEKKSTLSEIIAILSSIKNVTVQPLEGSKTPNAYVATKTNARGIVLNEIVFKIDSTNKKFRSGVGVVSFKPSAEVMESVIAFAFNHNFINRLKNDDDANIAYVTGISDKDSDIVNYYYENSEWLDRIATDIKSQCKGCKQLRKLPENEVSLSDEWVANGGVKKTPKTDVISADAKYKLSFKEIGDSQMMSGVKGEAEATIKCVFRKYIGKFKGERKEELEDLIDAIFSGSWTPRTKFTDDAALSAARDKNRELKLLMQQLLTDKDFRLAVVTEAISGRIKFGENSPACANYMFIWNPSGKSKIESIEQYAAGHCDNVKVDVNFKGGSGTKTTVLRLSSSSK